jgi:hypothetical protein
MSLRLRRWDDFVGSYVAVRTSRDVYKGRLMSVNDHQISLTDVWRETSCEHYVFMTVALSINTNKILDILLSNKVEEKRNEL